MKKVELRKIIREEIVKIKINEGFEYDPSIDYLERYDLLPKNVRDYIGSLTDDDINGPLSGRKKIVKRLEKMGWTIEYDFTPDGMWGLRPIGTDSDYI